MESEGDLGSDVSWLQSSQSSEEDSEGIETPLSWQETESLRSCNSWSSLTGMEHQDMIMSSGQIPCMIQITPPSQSEYQIISPRDMINGRPCIEDIESMDANTD